MALLRELSFLPLNSRDEFTTLRKFLTMEEFKSEHLAEELEIATHFLKEPEATEIRDILMERAAVGDVKRASVTAMEADAPLMAASLLTYAKLLPSSGRQTAG